MSMKKLMSLILMACLLCGVCAAADESDEPITLTMWFTSSTVEREEFVNEAVAEFEAMYPNVHVETTFLTDSGESKALTAYAAGTGPDVFRANITTEYVSAGYIIPIDQYLETWEERSVLNANALESVRSWDITGNHETYLLPTGTTPTVLWIRSDWVKEVGGSVDSWENLFDTIEKMTDKDAGRYGLAIRGGSGGAQFLERMMYSYSGLASLFDENGVCTINDPKNVEFVERYLGMYNKCTAEGDISYGWTELSFAFDSGAAGVIIHNLGSAMNHVEAFEGDLSKFEAITMPMNDQGTHVNMIKQDAGFMISKTCKNPEWAFKLAAFFSTGEKVSTLCNMYGWIPFDKNVLETADWLHEYPWYDSVIEMLTDEEGIFYDTYSYLPGLKGVQSEIDTLQQYVMAGEMSAQEFCDTWAELMQAEYDSFYN